MKMPDQKDEMLVGFFEEMKEKDKELITPPFPHQKKPRRWILVPLGVAASLLLMMWYMEDPKPSNTLEHDIVIITMEEGSDQELKLDIQTASSMDIWESPTSSLLTEY